MEDLYDKNFKSLKKEIEEDTRKGKEVPCSQVGRINNIKMSVLPKEIYRFNAMPSKILHRHQKNGTQLHIEKQINKDSKNNPVQYENFWRHHNP